MKFHEAEELFEDGGNQTALTSLVYSSLSTGAMTPIDMSKKVLNYTNLKTSILNIPKSTEMTHIGMSKIYSTM